MSRLLEILGRGFAIDISDLIWQWLTEVKNSQSSSLIVYGPALDKIIGLTGKRKDRSAAEQLRLYLFDNPGCIYGRMAAAAIYLRNNEIENAIEELNSIYLRQPSNTMALYALGHCYERIDKQSEAIEFYQDCLKFKNYLQLPRQRLAAIYFKNGQLEKTIQEYERLREEYPGDVSTLITLGDLYVAGAEYEKAMHIFNSAILLHPDNYQAWHGGIEDCIQDGNLHKALDLIDDLIQEQGENVGLLIKRGDVLSMMDAAEQSVEQFEDAVRFCPDSLEATIKLGTHYLQAGAEKEAAQQFNRAVEINDQMVDAYIGLATANKFQGMTNEAKTILSLATAIAPNSSFLFAQTAALQFSTGFELDTPITSSGNCGDVLETIITAHRQQINLSPQNPDLHYRLGMLMMSVGRMSEGVKLFQKALEVNPTFCRARSKLAVCLFENGEHEPAMELLGDSRITEKTTLTLHYKTALLWCDCIKFASSLLNLEKSLHDNFTSLEATINISIVLQNLGLLDRAETLWDNLWQTTSGAMKNQQKLWPE